MDKLSVTKIDLSRASEVFEVLLCCSDETDFLACSSRERIESGTSLESFSAFLESTRHTDNEFFICLLDNKIIGMLGLHCESRKRSAHRISMGMNVLRDYWGMGAGSLLLDHAIAHFQSTSHLTKLELEVRADNHSAIGLYTKKGFVIEGELKNHLFVDSQYFSAYRMCIIKGNQ